MLFYQNQGSQMNLCAQKVVDVKLKLSDKMKTILVTGSSRGIGRETSKILASKGHRVFSASRNAVDISGCESLILDPGNPESIAEVTEYFTSNGIHLDGLVNNAGLLVNKPFAELTEIDLQSLSQVNWIGPALLIQAMIPLFNKGAHVVNISSMGGFQGSLKFSGLSGYSSVKGALGTLTECLQAELGGADLTFNVLCLGAVQTEMLKEAFPDYDAPTSPYQMGGYISEFVLFGHKSFAGRVLPVTISTP